MNNESEGPWIRATVPTWWATVPVWLDRSLLTGLLCGKDRQPPLFTATAECRLIGND